MTHLTMAIPQSVMDAVAEAFTNDAKLELLPAIGPEGVVVFLRVKPSAWVWIAGRASSIGTVGQDHIIGLDLLGATSLLVEAKPGEALSDAVARLLGEEARVLQ